MARASDTYTSAQAAQILGVSERRVRQLVNEGKLAGKRATDGTVRIAQQAVNEERKRRRSPAAPRATAGARKRAASSDGSEGVDVDALATAVATAVGPRLEGQLEITRQAESLMRDELSEERAARMQAEAQLAAAERRVAELETAANQRRGLFRRK
jgi:excisionase family DNA binding protein